MIGRGAQGRPWHPGVLAGHPVPTLAEMAATACEHYTLMLSFYGREAGLRHARKHVGWYLDCVAPATPPDRKAHLMTEKDAGTVLRALEELLLAGSGNPQKEAA
jgi:tRNA-dihydrouridine synthase B